MQHINVNWMINYNGDLHQWHILLYINNNPMKVVVFDDAIDDIEIIYKYAPLVLKEGIAYANMILCRYGYHINMPEVM